MNSILTSIIPLFPKWFARPFALPYVAGETTDGAIQAAESVISQGFSVTMDILGEHTKDVNDAKKITEDYCLLYKKIIEKNMDCTVSLKLTHLGLDISEELAHANLNKIIDAAKQGNIGLTIDMEGSSYTSKTLSIYKKSLDIYSKVGTVLQAYLKRSSDDLRNLISENLHLRICKGIYREDESISFQTKDEINKNYLTLCKTLLKGEGFAAIATHDTDLIVQLDNWITEKNISKNRFEFQVLYGVPMGDTLNHLKAKGYSVKVYIPFGDTWFEYSIRRLKENPNIAGYVLKNLFRRK